VNIGAYATYGINHSDGTAHVGSAIIVRKGMKHHDLDRYDTDHTQATNVSIGDWDGHLAISANYCPTRHAIKKKQCNEIIPGCG
jgi:hypothetical protein